MLPKKKFGQHFLTSQYYAQRIADSVPARSDELVLEIGAGRGDLSIYLKERYPEFHCIEKDIDLIPILENKLGEGPWTVHNCDFLKFDFDCFGDIPLHIVGNLPYNVGALIIKKILFSDRKIFSLTFMVQREVAERIVSSSHARSNGFLSIMCQFFGEPRILFHVPEGAFYPIPDVKSSVFQLMFSSRLSSKIERKDWESFFSFVSMGFSMRRKMLVNTIGKVQKTDKKLLGQSLRETGIKDTVRAEDLDVEEWINLFQAYNRLCVA